MERGTVAILLLYIIITGLLTAAFRKRGKKDPLIVLMIVSAFWPLSFAVAVMSVIFMALRTIYDIGRLVFMLIKLPKGESVESKEKGVKV